MRDGRGGREREAVGVHGVGAGRLRPGHAGAGRRDDGVRRRDARHEAPLVEPPVRGDLRRRERVRVDADGMAGSLRRMVLGLVVAADVPLGVGENRVRSGARDRLGSDGAGGVEDAVRGAQDGGEPAPVPRRDFGAFGEAEAVDVDLPFERVAVHPDAAVVGRDLGGVVRILGRLRNGEVAEDLDRGALGALDGVRRLEIEVAVEVEGVVAPTARAGGVPAAAGVRQEHGGVGGIGQVRPRGCGGIVRERAGVADAVELDDEAVLHVGVWLVEQAAPRRNRGGQSRGDGGREQG